MSHLIKFTVPELGDITLNRNVTHGILSEAEKHTENVAENEKATVFVNFVLANMFVEPEMSSEEIAALSDETIQALITSVAEILSVQKEFEDLPDNLSPQEKLHKAYYQHLSNIFAEIAFPKIDTTQFVAQFAKAIEPLIAVSELVNAQFKQAMEAFLPQFAELVKQAKERWDAAEVDANTVAPLLDQANLWISPFAIMDVPGNLIPRLKAVVDRENPTPEMIEEAFIEYFEENDWEKLSQMVSSWENNPHFADRMLIIFDALEAHINEKYTLSVPTILPQVEGVTSSILGISASRRTGDQISNILQNELPEYRRAAFRDILVRFVTDIAYTGTDFNDFITDLSARGINESDFLNRHSILHGVQTNYANKGISLRAFLLLDALSVIE